MKKIIIAVALLLLLAILIGTLVYFNTPKELRALKKDIKRNGEYSESSDTRLLTVADTTKAYTGENVFICEVFHVYVLVFAVEVIVETSAGIDDVRCLVEGNLIGALPGQCAAKQ